MGDALKGIAGSKKYMFAIVVIAMLLVARKLNVELTMQEIIAIFGLAAGTNIAQGLADSGKEKSKVDHDAAIAEEIRHKDKS